jgi:hypothetical protein
MRLWASVRSLAGGCSGRFLKGALGGLLLISTLATAQTPQTPTPKKVGAERANELTLAGLRPGRDTASRAVQLYKQPNNKTESQDAQMVWTATCQTQTLSVDLDAGRKIQVVRTVETEWSLGDCLKRSPGPWKTGRGLRVGDAAAKVVQLYGEPDSRSPSTKGGQPLELWYYAFDWAAPDVPQVMEVLCTKKKEGEPGRVVEITLAAPSL